MTGPQQQVIDKCKEVFEIAKRIYMIDISRTDIRFDLSGRCRGMAGHKPNGGYYVRFNRDMLMRDAGVVEECVPHELAHIVCFMQPRLGSNHDNGWKDVCRTLGGTGNRTHNEDVVYGNGNTYEYTTNRGHKVRLSERRHAYIQQGGSLTYRKGKGVVIRECGYSVVGVQGRTLANPIVKQVGTIGHTVPATGLGPLTTPKTINPLVMQARQSFTIGYAPAQRTIPPEHKANMAGMSKAAISRSLMLAGYQRGDSYETVIAAMITANGYTRQLARATYLANAAKVGIPV